MTEQLLSEKELKELEEEMESVGIATLINEGLIDEDFF